MKIPLLVKCHACGADSQVVKDLHGRLPSFRCKCGQTVSGVLDNSVTLGFQLLHRASYELNDQKDYALSIVFSAAAFECELSRLHHKWTSINGLKNRKDLTDAQLDAMLRKYPPIDLRIRKVTELMFPGGIEAYVAQDAQLSAQITRSFPLLNKQPLSKAIQTALFWPRNGVLHLGRTKFSQDDASRRLNVATLCIYILQALDSEKRKQPLEGT